MQKLAAARSSVASATLLGIGSAWAVDVNVALEGAQETPPVETLATGTAKFSIGEDKSVTGGVETKGIEGTVEHIHIGAPGASGPPIITLTKNADGTWSVPAGSKLTDEQYASFKTGDLYVNVHSAEHKAGEIRGCSLGFSQSRQPLAPALILTERTYFGISACNVTYRQFL